MKPKYRRPWLIALALLGAAALGWAFRPQPVSVNVSPVTRGPLIVTIDEEGRTRIKERFIVSAPLAGRLLRVALRPGDAVEAGKTVLTALEPAEADLLDPRARAQAEARLKSAEASRERSIPLLERARTAHDYAATDLARARELHASQGLSHRELDAAEQREAETSAELKSAEFERRIADYEVEVARAALVGRGPDEANGSEGRRLEIRAPISGRVLRVFQESSTVVAAGTRLVEIGDPDDLEIVVEVLSTDAVKVRPGVRMLIEHWGGDESLPARVRTVEPSGFTKVSALGVEEQRVNVIADFTGPASAHAIGDGFRVEARIVIWESADVLKVPSGALFRDGDEWAVFVVERGRAALRPVTIGRRNSREAEVLGGLAAGETLVLHPGDNVEAGTRLRLRE